MEYKEMLLKEAREGVELLGKRLDHLQTEVTDANGWNEILDLAINSLTTLTSVLWRIRIELARGVPRVEPDDPLLKSKRGIYRYTTRRG